MLYIIRTLHISKTIQEEHTQDMIRAFQRCLGSGAKPEKLHHTKHILYALRAGRSKRIIYTRHQATPTSILVLDFLANHEYQKIDHNPNLYEKLIKESILTTDFTTYSIFPDDATAGLVVFSDATHHPTSVQPQKVLTMDQVQALSTLYQKKPPISVIQGPAGSGKSMLTPWLFACLRQPGKKLYLAPSKELALQQRKRLQAFLHHHDDFKPHLDIIVFCFVDTKTLPTNDILSLYGDAGHSVLPLIPDHNLHHWCQHQCSTRTKAMPSSSELEHLLISLDIKMQTITHNNHLTNEAWHTLEHELREQYPEATANIAPGCITAWYQQYTKHRHEKKWRSEDDDARWFHQQRDLQHQDKKLFSECERASLMQVLHILDALPLSAHKNFITTSNLTPSQQERIPALLASYRAYQNAHNLRNITAHDAMTIASTYPVIVMDEWLQDLPIGYQLVQAVQQKNHQASPHQTHRLFFLGDITQAKIPFPLQTVLSPLAAQDQEDDLVCITLHDSHRTPVIITAVCQRILYEIHGRIGANLGALPTLNACNQAVGSVHIVRHQQPDAVASLAQRIQHQFIDTLCIVHTQTQADWLMKLLSEHIHEDDVLIQIVETPSDIAGLEFANMILLDDVLSQLPLPEYFLRSTQTTPLSHKHKNKHATQAQLQYIYALRTLYLYVSRALSSLSIVSTKNASGPIRKWLDCIEQVAKHPTQTPTTISFPTTGYAPDRALQSTFDTDQPPNRPIDLDPSVKNACRTNTSTISSQPQERYADNRQGIYNHPTPSSNPTTTQDPVHASCLPAPQQDPTEMIHRILDFIKLKGSHTNVCKLVKKYQLDILKKEKKEVIDAYAHYVLVIKRIYEHPDLDLNIPTLQSILQAPPEDLDQFEDFLRKLALGSVDPALVPKHVESNIWQQTYTLSDAIAYHTSQHIPNVSTDQATPETTSTSTSTSTNEHPSASSESKSYVKKAKKFFKKPVPGPLTEQHIDLLTQTLDNDVLFDSVFIHNQPHFLEKVDPSHLSYSWTHPITNEATSLLHGFMQHASGREEIKRYCADQNVQMGIPTVSLFFSSLNPMNSPTPLLSLAIDYDPESIEKYWPKSEGFSQLLYMRCFHSHRSGMLDQLANDTFLLPKQYAAAKLAKLYFTHVLFLRRKKVIIQGEYYEKMKQFGGFLVDKMALLWHSKKGYALLRQYAKIMSDFSLNQLPGHDPIESADLMARELHFLAMNGHFHDSPEKPTDFPSYHHQLEQILSHTITDVEVCQQIQNDIIGFVFYLEKPYDLLVKALQHGHFKAAKYISERTEALSDIADYNAFANIFIPLCTKGTSKMVKLASGPSLHLLAAYDLAAILKTFLQYTTIKLPPCIVYVLGIYSSMNTIQMLHEHNPALLLQSNFSESIVVWACFAEKKGLKAKICNAFNLPMAPATTQARDWLLIHYPEKFLEIDALGRSILKSAIICPLDSLVIWLIRHQAILPKLFAREWIRLLLLGTPKYRRLTTVRHTHNLTPHNNLLIAQNNHSLSCVGLFNTNIKHLALSSSNSSNSI